MWWSPPSPQSPYSPMSDSDIFSPRTMHGMLEDEVEDMEAAIEEELRFRDKHGFGAMSDAAFKRLRKEAAGKKKALVPAEAAHEDLPPQSPVYEYGASESSDEPYSDEERGPMVVDQPPTAIDQPPEAEANVVNEDDSGISGSRSGSCSAAADDEDVDDANVIEDFDSDSEDSKGSDASEVTSASPR